MSDSDGNFSFLTIDSKRTDLDIMPTCSHKTKLSKVEKAKQTHAWVEGHNQQNSSKKRGDSTNLDYKFSKTTKQRQSCTQVKSVKRRNIFKDPVYCSRDSSIEHFRDYESEEAFGTIKDCLNIEPLPMKASKRRNEDSFIKRIKEGDSMKQRRRIDQPSTSGSDSYEDDNYWISYSKTPNSSKSWKSKRHSCSCSKLGETASHNLPSMRTKKGGKYQRKPVEIRVSDHLTSDDTQQNNVYTSSPIPNKASNNNSWNIGISSVMESSEILPVHNSRYVNSNEIARSTSKEHLPMPSTSGASPITSSSKSFNVGNYSHEKSSFKNRPNRKNTTKSTRPFVSAKVKQSVGNLTNKDISHELQTLHSSIPDSIAPVPQQECKEYISSNTSQRVSETDAQNISPVMLQNSHKVMENVCPASPLNSDSDNLNANHISPLIPQNLIDNSNCASPQIPQAVMDNANLDSPQIARAVIDNAYSTSPHINGAVIDNANCASPQIHHTEISNANQVLLQNSQAASKNINSTSDMRSYFHRPQTKLSVAVQNVKKNLESFKRRSTRKVLVPPLETIPIDILFILGQKMLQSRKLRK